MRTRKDVVVAAFLITWVFVLYYFTTRNHNDIPADNYKDLTHKLENLEQEADKLHQESERLMLDLRDVLKTKFERQKQSNEQLDYMGLSPGQLLSLQQPPEALKNDELNLGKEESINVPTGTAKTLTHLPNGQPVIPVLVFACNRISISKCLDNLVQYRPSAEQFPIIVSQDCGDEATKNVILSYKSKVTLIEQPDQSNIFVPPKERKFKGYYKIARHYGWALNTTFNRGYEFVIIVEDDLNVSPDFYQYFLGTHELLRRDSSLWCVSAWNDNGKENLIDPTHPELLYRTDFFPGLGWMLTNKLWQELSIKWPKSFWDDWIRQPEQRKNRVCIRPEISRTRTFGKIGVSNGLFFDKYLKHIKLSVDFVDFTKLDLSYLLKENYDNTFVKEVYNYPIVTYDELRRNLIRTDGPVRIQYMSSEQYKRLSKMLGLMDDFKSGVPRTAYQGIVSFMYNKRRVHLAPNINWKGYNLNWS